MTATPASPQVKDTTITVTCDATGGAQLLYQFWINDGSGWQIAQAYSMSNKFIWRPAAGGFYKISVYVKDKNSANYVDALKQLSYVVYDKAITINSLTTDKASPQAVGTTITVTCDATGGAQLLYQFWINDGSGWQIAQAYSMSNKFIWRPAAGGFYKISVYVKDKNSANYVDALKQLSYVVYDKAITINSLTTDKASPQAVGIPITVTADATGGAELLYQFWVNDGVSWKVVQGYSASDTYLWTPTVPGNYKLSVYVKDYYSTKSLDTYMQIGFVVK
ncbi:MAG: hypothetical protein AUK32_07725 [Candidatus Aquicultor secundus]|nr:MAG: hypothetical protein AUK32_07725 [Candidatus Aquicultor secundus]